MFIYFWERQRQNASGLGQRERETQNLKQAPGSELSAQIPTRGSNPRAVRSWPEPKSDAQPTEPSRCPSLMSSFKSVVHLKKIFFYVYLFFVRDRARAGEEKREREAQNPKQAPESELSAQSPTRGSNPREIMTWAEAGCLTNWATQVPLSYNMV